MKIIVKCNCGKDLYVCDSHVERGSGDLVLVMYQCTNCALIQEQATDDNPTTEV